MLLVVVAGGALAQGAPEEQRKLQLIGGLPREQQRVPVTQDWLVGFVRRAASLYLHRLDGLACQELFGMGNEPAFHAAVGSVGGTDQNRVYIDGTEAPQHLDEGPYVFPSDTWRAYWPIDANRNTYWHEVQHALLERAGVGVAPGPYGASMDKPGDPDDHHALIEGVGQRGAEAYGELLGFEAAVRRADAVESEYLAQGRDPSEYGVQRQLWGEAHQRFSAFVKGMRRVANMPAEDLARYRSATGVYFSSVEQVAEWYRRGGLKRQERGETLPVRPPGWVFFPDLMLMPARILLADAKGRDLEAPGAAAEAPSEVKDDVFRQAFLVTVRARGSMARWSETNRAKNLAVMGAVTRGRLRIRLVEDEPLVTLSVSGAAGIAVPGGTSSKLVDVDLSQAGVQPLRVTVARRQLSSLKAPVTYHVVFEFTDPGAQRLYDSATAQLGLPLGISSGGSPGSTPRGPPPPAPPPPSGGATTTGRAPLGVQVQWSGLPGGVTAHSGSMQDRASRPLGASGSLELVSGPSMYFSKGDWGAEGGFFLEVFSRRLDKNLVTLDEYVASVRPKDPGRPAQDWFARFTHRETKLAGLRAFESVTTGRMQRNHHWFVELDPQRQLWATLLGDVKVSEKNVDAMDGLAANMDAVARALSFVTADAPALEVTRSEAPVPRSLTEAPVQPNEIANRPPPPPPEPGGRRRRRAAVVEAPPVPTAPPVAPGPPAPPPPPSKAAPAPVPAGAQPLALKGRLAAGASIILTNTSGRPWSGCTLTLPGHRTLRVDVIRPNEGLEFPVRTFRVDPSAEDVKGQLLVRCAEGEGSLRVRL
jgi:hypothetical protein